MGRCPKCKKKIDYLNAFSEARQKFEVMGGGIYYGDVDMNCDEIEYECPSCSEVVADNEGDAEKILKKR